MVCWPCQMKAICFCWSLLTGIEKKAFLKETAEYQVPGDVFICSSDETTSGTPTAIGVVTQVNLQHSTVLQQPCLCPGQPGTSNGDVVGMTTSAPLKSLIVALIFAVSPGSRHCFCFTIFLGVVTSCVFPLASPTIIALLIQVRESV